MPIYITEMSMDLYAVNGWTAIKISEVKHMLSAKDNTSHSTQLFKELKFNNLRRTYPGRKKEASMAQTKFKILSDLSIISASSRIEIITKA